MTTEAEPMTDVVEDQALPAGECSRACSEQHTFEPPCTLTPAAGGEAASDDEAGPQISIVIDGREISDEELEQLLQKPLDELTDAEREGLRPLFDEVAAQRQPQGVDALQVAFSILQDASELLFSKPPAGQRLEHKIALGHAMAALVQAQATRQLAMLTQQQLRLVMQAQQEQVARAAGPAGIVIPSAQVRL